MGDTLTQVFTPFLEVGLGDIVDIPFPTAGTIGIYPIEGGTWPLAGLDPRIVLSAEDSCFFSTINAIPPIPPSSANPPFPPVWPYLFSTGEIYGRDHLSTNLKMIRRDDYIFDIAIILNGVVVDLTGGTLTMTAKWDVGDTDANAVFVLTSPSGGISITDAINGLARVTIASANTFSLPLHKVNLVYDIELVNSIGLRFTVLNGVLTVIPDLSHANP